MNAAQQLSHWIETEHPDFFRHLYLQIATARNAKVLSRSHLRGFGDDGGDLTEFVPDFSATDTIPTDYAAADFSVPTVDASSLAAPDTTSFSTALTNTGGDSGSFLDSLGAGIASAAQAVGSALTNPQVLQGVAQLGAAYFQTQQVKANAAVQTQVLQAQITRAQMGLPPAPLTYTVGSNGQVIPVYAGNTLPATLSNAYSSGLSQRVILPDGSIGYTVPSNILGGLTNMSLGDALPWLLLVGAALVLL